MARTDALLWWPAAAEVLVLTCAVALTCGGQRGGVESPVPDTRQIGVPDGDATDGDATDDDAADDDAADDDAADDDAVDDDATKDVATDEEATDPGAHDTDEDDTDATSAEARAANARAAGALERAERYESGGQYLECAQELAPIKWRLSMVENGDVVEAVEDTFTRCEDEHEKQYEPIQAKDCALKIEDAIAATAAPPRLVPKAAKTACLALVPGSSKTQEQLYGGGVCPRVALVWSAGGLHRRELAFDGGPLADGTWCCNLESIGAGTLDGTTLIRLGGVGHPCGGGTAYKATDGLYEWNGKLLSSPLDLSIGFH